MGQDDVINLLKKNKRPLTSTEIADLLDIGMRSVRRILKCLLEDTTVDICYKKLSKEEKIERYGRNINLNKIGVYYLKK